MPPRKKPPAASAAPPKTLRPEDFGESDEHIDLAAVVIAATAGFASNPHREPTTKGIVGFAKLVLESEEDWPPSSAESEDGEDVFFDLLCASVQAVCARSDNAKASSAALVKQAVEMAENLWDALLVGCAELDESGGDDEDEDDGDNLH